MFITVHTTVRQASLSWYRWTQFTTTHPISLKSILILSYHLWLGVPSGLVHRTLHVAYSAHKCHMSWQSHPLFHHLNDIFSKTYYLRRLSLCIFLQSADRPSTFDLNTSINIPSLNNYRLSPSINVRDQTQNKVKLYSCVISYLS